MGFLNIMENSRESEFKNKEKKKMAKRERNPNNWSRICPVCGKEFFPGPEWVYKNIDGIYCTWGCMRRRERELHEQIKKYKYKPVEQLDTDGNVIAEYSCAYDVLSVFDFTLSNLRYACLKNLKYKGYIWRYKKIDETENKDDNNPTNVG